MLGAGYPLLIPSSSFSIPYLSPIWRSVLAFLTGDQFANSYDERKIRQLLQDQNVPITGGLSGNGVLEQIMLEATGEILAACETGERYTEGQLQALADDTASAGGAVLRRLCADLTFAMLVARRGQSAADVDRQCPRYSIARSMLEQLRMGSRVFPGAEEASNAGLPSIGNVNPNLNLNRPNLLTSKASRLFPFDCTRNRPNPNSGCC